jgi:hypothetical protein
LDVYLDESGGPEASNPRLRRSAWGLAILSGEDPQQVDDDSMAGDPGVSGAGLGVRVKPNLDSQAVVTNAFNRVLATPAEDSFDAPAPGTEAVSTAVAYMPAVQLSRAAATTRVVAERSDLPAIPVTGEGCLAGIDPNASVADDFLVVGAAHTWTAWSTGRWTNVKLHEGATSTGDTCALPVSAIGATSTGETCALLVSACAV